MRPHPVRLDVLVIGGSPPAGLAAVAGTAVTAAVAVRAAASARKVSVRGTRMDT
ncbi:hypothetical protein GCM10020000_18610 [Streptomyces olivoverticillatus]